jgi:hypothetical protein
MKKRIMKQDNKSSDSCCRAKTRGRLYSRLVSAMFIAMLVANASGLGAQVNQTIYFMDKLPQSSLLNPAYQHAHSFHIGLPLISSINLSAGTNFASFSDLIFRHPHNDSLISFLHPDASLEDFTSRLRKVNSFTPDLHLNILSFGFRVKRSFFSFNISERTSFQASLPKDLVLLMLNGNAQFAGQTADFSNLSADLNYFREYGLGYSRSINRKLDVGARAKLLFGKANFSISDSDIGLYTDPDSYELQLRSKFTVNFALPLTLINGNIDEVRMHFDDEDYNPLDFVFNTGNPGFALDLGATYRLLDQLTLYASVVDLGFISWKKDVYNLSMDGSFEYEGLDLSSSFDSADDSKPGSSLLDTLNSIFTLEDSSNAFTRGLPARVFLGGTWELNHLLNFGLLSRSRIYQNSLEQAFTLSANYNFRRWFSASASYSAMNNSYNNLGLGFSLRGGGMQFYMLTDNLNSVFYPHHTRGVNLWFGLNLVFGHKSRPDY